jgi:hypothetical protein
MYPSASKDARDSAVICFFVFSRAAAPFQIDVCLQANTRPHEIKNNLAEIQWPKRLYVLTNCRSWRDSQPNLNIALIISVLCGSVQPIASPRRLLSARAETDAHRIRDAFRRLL